MHKIFSLHHLPSRVRTLRRGFTLIELLVVIVIIGILATIGVASFNDYMGKARDAKRATHIRDFSIGLELYNVENACYLVSGTGYNGNGTGLIFVGYNGGLNIAELLQQESYLTTHFDTSSFDATSSTESLAPIMYANCKNYGIFLGVENPKGDYAINGVWHDLEGTHDAPTTNDLAAMNQVFYNGPYINGTTNANASKLQLFKTRHYYVGRITQ